MQSMTELKTIPIIPNGLRYWVMPDKAEDTSIVTGGITLSGEADDKKPPLQGRIVAVGDATLEPGAQVSYHASSREWGKSPACKYQRGNLVVFGAYAGNVHRFEGVDYTILHEDEILGLVIETPFDRTTGYITGSI